MMNRFSRHLVTSIGAAFLLFGLAQGDINVLADLSASAASVSAAVYASTSTVSQHHRRTQQEREPCPTGIAFCDDPFDILDDPTVACDEDTCAWLITLLSPQAKPLICQSITFVGDTAPDFLEPCLWWEILYGGLKPTPSPTGSDGPSAAPTTANPTNSPSASPSDSLVPTVTPTATPSSAPSSKPSGGPSSVPSRQPTEPPTRLPSSVPSVSISPSSVPTVTASGQPSSGPSVEHSQQPSETPSNSPLSPTSAPSFPAPTSSPSNPMPTSFPTSAPSAQPSNSPPTSQPSISFAPTMASEKNVVREFETVLLNYFVRPVNVENNNGGNNRNLRSRRQLQAFTFPQPQETAFDTTAVITTATDITDSTPTDTAIITTTNVADTADVTPTDTSTTDVDTAAAEADSTTTTNTVNIEIDNRRTPLEMVTAEHLLFELRRGFGPVWDQVVDVDVRVDQVQVQTFPNNNGTIVVTEAVTGIITLASTLADIRAVDLNNMVDNAFCCAALQRYAALLLDNPDAVVQRTVQVTAGLPPDLQDTDGNAGNNFGSGNAGNNNQGNTGWPNNNGINGVGNNANADDDDDESWSDNLVWIAVIAGTGAGAIGLVVLGLLLVRRGRRRNLEGQGRSSRPVGDSKGRLGIKESKTQSPASDNSSSNNYKRSPNSARKTTPVAGQRSNNSNSKRNTNNGMAAVAEMGDDVSLADNSHFGEQSQATSVYSYIDANLMDDQSFADKSYMYASGMAGSGDESLPSAVASPRIMWSGSYNGGSGGQQARNGDQLQVYNSEDDDNDYGIVHGTPSKMVVTTAVKRNGNEFFIFADDDDDLSMMSDAAKAPTIPPSSEEKKHEQMKMQKQQLQQQKQQQQHQQQQKQAAIQFVPREATAPVPSPIINKNNSVKVAAARASGKAETLVDPLMWGFDDYVESDSDNEDANSAAYADVDDSNDMDNEPPLYVPGNGMRRLPLGDLAPVDESTQDAYSTSSVGSKSSSKQSWLTAPSTKENNLNRGGSDTDLVSKGSEDDASSQYTEGSVDGKDDNKASPLSSTDKIRTDRDKDGRFKPLSPVSGLSKYHSKQSLFAQDKTSLGSQMNQSDDDDVYEQEEESLRLPPSYSLMEEKKADTIGPDINTAASF